MAATTAVLAGVASVADLAGAVAVVVTVGVGAALLVGAGVWRANRRRALSWSLMTVVGQLLKAPVVLRGVRWRGLPVGRIVKVTVEYTDLAAAVYGGHLPRLVTNAVEQASGRAFTVRRHREQRRALTLGERPVAAEEALSNLGKACARVSDVVGETFGADATVSNVKTGDDLVTEFTVHYRAAAARLTVPAVRRRVVTAVGERLTGQWKAQFELEGDAVTFKRRPPLPTYVARPAPPAPMPDDAAFNLIPQGVDEDGTVINWDISGVMAHFLRAGRTRTGKTVTVIGDALECARREMPVFVVDPKRVEFMGLRTWPNVQFVATTVQQQIGLIYKLKLEMDERYRLVEEEGFPDSEFHPILLIIDEYRQLYGNVQAWWKSIKVAGMPAECPVFEWIGSLLRMAAYCRIHVDLATQRPDAAFLAGEIRDNFSARAATGRLSPDGAEMMFDTVHVGVNIPLNVRGRGTIVGVDDQPKEVQFFYTPDPRRPRHDEDRQLLEKLRPATTRWPALAMHLPEPETFAEELPEGKKTNLEWEQLLRASFEPAEPNPSEADPADAAEDSPADEPVVDDELALDEAYNAASVVPAGMVATGDLLQLDAREGWTRVTDVAGDSSAGHGEVQIEWTDDDGQVGDLIIGRGELLEIRRLKS